MEGCSNLGRGEAEARSWVTHFEHIGFDLLESPLLYENYQQLVKMSQSVEYDSQNLSNSGKQLGSQTQPTGLDGGLCLVADGKTAASCMISKQERDKKIMRYLEKKNKRVYQKRVSYDCRKRVADNRLRVKGRFISKKEEKEISHTA